jgi:superfamily II DNA helicase RecQ
MPAKVRIYKPEELNLNHLASKTESILHKTPFPRQLDVAAAVLCGEDCVVDVGTGNRKTLSLQIPCVLNNTDMSLRVAPLTALMIDQVGDL